MRQFLSVGLLLLILAVAAPVSAQVSMGNFGATPPQINFQRINMAPMTANQNMSGMLRTPSQQQSFSLANVFHSITLPSWPPRISSAPVLPASQNRIQPNQNSSLNFFPTTATYPTTNNPYIINKAWN